jgi:RNA polymerase sigma-70 factor (ECF subfamily)
MSDDPLESLLEKLSTGEAAAAERVFLDFEPFLRAIVRRRLNPMLRSKFDSMDVVQSAWADVLVGFRERQWEFKDKAALKAFLARVTYNHFVNECRRHSNALEHEQSLTSAEADNTHASSQPRPSELVQADELWDKLMMLCPPAHREILKLKQQGLPLSEIAARVGMHEGSVRRILYDLAKRLASKQERSPGR